jgi:hypothetical protein
MELDQSKRVSEVAELLALWALHFDKPSDDKKTTKLRNRREILSSINKFIKKHELGGNMFKCVVLVPA